MPGAREVGIDGDRGAQRAAGGVAGDVRGTGRIVVCHRARERQAESEARPGAEPGDRGERVVRRLDPLSDRRRAVVDERSGRRRVAAARGGKRPAARGGKDVEREAGDARPGGEAELELVPPAAEHDARAPTRGGRSGRGPVRARAPPPRSTDRRALAGVVEDDVVGAGRPVERDADQARPAPARPRSRGDPRGSPTR